MRAFYVVKPRLLFLIPTHSDNSVVIIFIKEVVSMLWHVTAEHSQRRRRARLRGNDARFVIKGQGYVTNTTQCA